MILDLQLDPIEQAYVDTEVARLQRTDPAETAERFLARMTKKLVGKWVTDERAKRLEAVQADFLSLPHGDRDEAILTLEAKVAELRAKTPADAIEGQR